MTSNRSLLDEDRLYHIDNQIDNLVDLTEIQNSNANAIGNELEDQNQMLHETNNHMDKTSMMVDDAYLSTKKLNDGLQGEFKVAICTKIGWVIVFVLLITIILLWILLKRKK